MKQTLLLYVSTYSNPNKNAVAATLAWLAAEHNVRFDVYYDAYRLGVHFGGGDPDTLPFGHFTGSLVSGGRHLEQFYLLAKKFDVYILAQGDSLICSVARNLGVPFIAQTVCVPELYRRVFEFFETPIPSNVVIVDSNPRQGLKGIDAYFFPEIYYRRALGLEATVPVPEMSRLLVAGGKVQLAGVGSQCRDTLVASGFRVEALETVDSADTFCSITSRLARRWIAQSSGWIMGDPVLISYWLPTSCEEKLLPIYGRPQTTVIAELANELQSCGRVVLGRQFGDHDFFELSRNGQCLQVVDPNRPAFPSVRHIEYRWENTGSNLFDDEPTDDELEAFIENDKVLVSLVFWSGMIREVENLYNLVDLVALTNLRAGVALTSQSYEYARHGLLELLTVPLERGGASPGLEPLLGSCGIGVGIESLYSPERLNENLSVAMNRIRDLVGENGPIPRGWWGTMDVPMVPAAWHRRALPVALRTKPPFVRVKYWPREYAETANSSLASQANMSLTRKARRRIRQSKLGSLFEQHRPFDHYQAGSLSGDLVDAVKGVGLDYMFTKSGFGRSHIQHMDESFIALNYTAGRWDGWTPFLTINDVSDLRAAEKAALRAGEPGWITGTIDSCLWTFSGPFWERSHRLMEIARFLARGGDTRRLVNVTPHTIARYARLIERRKKLSKKV